MAENLKSRGINLHTDCSPTKIERDPNTGKLTVHFHCSSKDCDSSITASKVMFATGRRPATKGIGLEDAGVQLDEKKGSVLVDEYSRTNVPSIHAIGDVTGRMALTPVALMEGKALAASLFGGKPTKPNYENVRSKLMFCMIIIVCAYTCI